MPTPEPVRSRTGFCVGPGHSPLGPWGPVNAVFHGILGWRDFLPAVGPELPMRATAYSICLLLLSACSTLQPSNGPAPETSMREQFMKSLHVRLADAEVALTRFDNAGALKILDEVGAATKDWKKTSPAEDVALGWLSRQANEIRFIATVFGAEDQAEKLKELFAADSDRLFERFIGDGTTMQSPACYQLYATSGRNEEAERGYGRVFALLEGKQHEVKRFRLFIHRASTMAGLGFLKAALAELDHAPDLLRGLPPAKVEDLREFGTFCMLFALIHARVNQFGEAAWAMDGRMKDIPEHVAKPRIERYGKAFKELAQTWPAEEERYAKEPADLPKVEIETDKGKLVLTLFEDDCPNTVASFISLVEKGFYDGTLFHRVVPHFVVQGGDPTGNGNGGPGYCIKRELGRSHFRGSIGMARNADPDSAGSQFYFCLHAATTYHLNQGYCVFGRVSQGLEVMDQLRLGSKIIKARVLSKRAHDYQVERLPEKE